MRVMVLFEKGRAGQAAIDTARELAQTGQASLTVVGIVPQAEGGGPRCGGSARDYNLAVMEQIAGELHVAKRRLGCYADEARIELLVEGSDPPLACWSASQRFDTILLPARRRPWRTVKHPDAPSLARETTADVRIIDASGGADAARS
jgi:hypothetical protein